MNSKSSWALDDGTQGQTIHFLCFNGYRKGTRATGSGRSKTLTTFQVEARFATHVTSSPGTEKNHAAHVPVKELEQIQRGKTTRVNPQRAQSYAVQSRVASTHQAVKPKLLKCTECVVSGSEERRLFWGAHVLRITCAAVRYKLEHESFELWRASNITGSSHRRSLGRGLNNDQPVDGHVPRSLNDAILYATVHKRDQVPRLCTPSGSVQDLRRPKKKVRRI